VQLSFEKSTDALHIAIKVEISVGMRSGHNLRKINQNRSTVFMHQQIKLVEIAVNQARTGQSNDQVHQVRVQPAWVAHLFNMSQRTRFN